MLKTEAGATSGEGAESLVKPLWPDTGKALGLGKNSTYEAAKKGEIPTVKFGRLMKVPLWFHKSLREGTAA